MFNSNDNEFEVMKLIQEYEMIAQTIDCELDGYCEHMKGIFMSTSGIN